MYDDKKTLVASASKRIEIIKFKLCNLKVKKKIIIH